MKLYRHRISLTIICEDKKLKLYSANMIQSPGPVPYLADVSMEEMDPCVEAISLEKSSALTSSEAGQYLSADDNTNYSKPNKKAKSSSKKVRVKSGLVHQGDFKRAMLTAELEKHGIAVEDGKVRKSDIQAALKAIKTVSSSKKS